MSIKKVNATEFSEWVDSLAKEKNVIGVQSKGERFAFMPLKSAADLRLDYDVTVLPPKEHLQPPIEEMLAFSAEDGYKSLIDDEQTVLFGVHPYDLVGILQMDKIFSADNGDERYARRRGGVTIVTVDAERASENVFAGHMGTATVSEGYDVLITKIGDCYLVDAATEKGEALAASLSGSEAGDAELEARSEVWTTNEELLKKHDLKAKTEDWEKLLLAGYDAPVWGENADKCFSCGSCNLVCPTCYCFDVKDETDWTLKKGVRSRTWDGCMLASFAAVAGDHNFREERAARYRHRYLRKGAYIPSKLDGEIACVGCGRCITACVAKIANPVDILNGLQEDV